MAIHLVRPAGECAVATRVSANAMARHDLILVAAAQDSPLSIFVRPRSTQLDSMVIILGKVHTALPACSIRLGVGT